MFIGPLLLLIFLFVLCSHWFTPSHSCGHHREQNHHHTVITPASTNKPMEILKERYAKGEIGEEEYLRIKRNLE